MNNSLSHNLSHNLPWIEKYRPSHLSDIVSHTHIIHTLNMYIQNNTFPNIILFGPSGTGKTSIIMACAHQLFHDNKSSSVLEINASEERGIDVIRSTIAPFTYNNYNWTFVPNQQDGISNNSILLKLVILDEADSMTSDAQMALKNIMDNSYSSSRFCLLCNSIEKIHPTIISRCVKFRLPHIDITCMTKKLLSICQIENMSITYQLAEKISVFSHGDMRKALNVLQTIHSSYSSIDEICINKYLHQIPHQLMLNIIEYITSHNINAACSYVFQIINTNPFSLHDIINELNNYMTHSLANLKKNQIKWIHNLSLDQKLNIISHCATLEYQLFSNVSHKILVPILVIILKKSQKN
jgi:replication factor C subunit 3/5